MYQAVSKKTLLKQIGKVLKELKDEEKLRRKR